MHGASVPPIHKRALHEFSAARDDELSFPRGSVLTLRDDRPNDEDDEDALGAQNSWIWAERYARARARSA
jgi:hypothetical protein